MQAYAFLDLASRFQRVLILALSLYATLRWPVGFSGVLAGGLLGLINVLWMRHMASQALTARGVLPRHVALAMLKSIVLLALTTGAWFALRPDPLAFIIGLGTFFVALMLTGLYVLVRPATLQPATAPRQGSEEPAPCESLHPERAVTLARTAQQR